MGANDALAERFERIAAMLEILGEDRFRVNAHARAARAIKDQTTDLSALADDPGALRALDGIGPKAADKIIEFARTGEIGEHAALLEKVPAGLLEVLEVPGVGPKTVGLLWRELGVEDIAGLRHTIENGSILSLPRMGKKTVENIREALEFAGANRERMNLGLAEPIGRAIAERMRSVAGVTRAELAGSVRRGQETIGDLDVLVSCADAKAVRKAFTTMDGVTKVLARGETKCSVRMVAALDSGRWKGEGGEAGLQVDLRIVPEERFGAALMYFTGSKEHNVRLRERANSRGLTLNEYGLYTDDGGDGTPHSRGLEPIACARERDVYTALGLPFVTPELREDRGELGLEEEPALVEVSDIRAELHAHTDESDGRIPMRELVELARARGFHTIAVTDHSRSSAVAGGLSADRLREQIERVRALNDEFEDIEVLAGSEVDIHADGSLDYDDGLLAELDVVVASPHIGLKAKPAQATKRLLRAITHPLVHVLGHPTGRLIGRRPGMEPAMDELIAAAIEHRTALEINCHWMRLDLRDTHVRAAVEAGATIAVNCDVHTPEDFENIRFGVATGRRGWLTRDRCVNCWSANDLHAWLRASRPSV